MARVSVSILVNLVNAFTEQDLTRSLNVRFSVIFKYGQNFQSRELIVYMYTLIICEINMLNEAVTILNVNNVGP